MKPRHLNQILVVMNYEWTLDCGPGNGPWAFCSSWKAEAADREEGEQRDLLKCGGAMK